ncbi:helix-turn-helix domain-containing protein [Mesorhizobium sp. B3-1-9]|nr:helix-turn-helix domain-containing protein [Mesorhizobium sp. B3-1-9]
MRTGRCETPACSLPISAVASQSRLRGRVHDGGTLRLGPTAGAQQGATALPARTSASISEIAFACGFNSSPHFSRAFKSKYDVAPRGVRERVHGGALTLPDRSAQAAYLAITGCLDHCVYQVSNSLSCCSA